MKLKKLAILAGILANSSAFAYPTEVIVVNKSNTEINNLTLNIHQVGHDTYANNYQMIGKNNHNEFSMDDMYLLYPGERTDRNIFYAGRSGSEDNWAMTFWKYGSSNMMMQKRCNVYAKDKDEPTYVKIEDNSVTIALKSGACKYNLSHGINSLSNSNHRPYYVNYSIQNTTEDLIQDKYDDLKNMAGDSEGKLGYLHAIMENPDLESELNKDYYNTFGIRRTSDHNLLEENSNLQQTNITEQRGEMMNQIMPQIVSAYQRIKQRQLGKKLQNVRIYSKNIDVANDDDALVYIKNISSTTIHIPQIDASIFENKRDREQRYDVQKRTFSESETISASSTKTIAHGWVAATEISAKLDIIDIKQKFEYNGKVETSKSQGWSKTNTYTYEAGGMPVDVAPHSMALACRSLDVKKHDKELLFGAKFNGYISLYYDIVKHDVGVDDKDYNKRWKYEDIDSKHSGYVETFKSINDLLKYIKDNGEIIKIGDEEFELIKDQEGNTYMPVKIKVNTNFVPSRSSYYAYSDDIIPGKDGIPSDIADMSGIKKQEIADDICLKKVIGEFNDGRKVTPKFLHSKSK